MVSRWPSSHAPADAVCASAVPQDCVVCKCSSLIVSLHCVIPVPPRESMRYMGHRRASDLYPRVPTEVSIGNSHSAGISSSSAEGSGPREYTRGTCGNACASPPHVNYVATPTPMCDQTKTVAIKPSSLATRWKNGEASRAAIRCTTMRVGHYQTPSPHLF